MLNNIKLTRKKSSMHINIYIFLFNDMMYVFLIQTIVRDDNNNNKLKHEKLVS